MHNRSYVPRNTAGDVAFSLMNGEWRLSITDVSKTSKIPKNSQKTFQKPIDKQNELWYNMQVVKTRPIGQAVKTLASHAGNSGSIPGWVTKIGKAPQSRCFPYFVEFI